MEFVNPRELPFAQIRSRGELPHLFKEGCIYFVTFRLLDAVIPRTKRKPIGMDDPCEEIAAHSEPPLTLGGCELRKPEVAQIVQDALLYFQGVRYLLDAWCVMPNHVHAVFAPTGGMNLSKITHSWKSFTGNQINDLLNKEGTFWERESFDHLIRSEHEMRRLVEYVEFNPVAAGLCQTPEQWVFSSAYPGNIQKVLR
jgi:REP element-mobilizing transposase RayT